MRQSMAGKNAQGNALIIQRLGQVNSIRLNLVAQCLIYYIISQVLANVEKLEKGIMKAEEAQVSYTLLSLLL